MALTVTLLAEGNSPGGLKTAVFSVTPDASYPAGGEAIEFTTWFSTVHSVSFAEAGTVNTTGQFQPTYDRAAAKVYIRDVGVTLQPEVTATTDLSSYVFRCTVIGVE